MDYISKVYYKDFKNYEKIYKNRYEFETTLRLDLKINPYKTNENLSLYYVFNNETSRYLDLVRENDNRLNEIELKLPEVAKKSLLKDIISSELQSSNELEGVESSREQIAETTREIIEHKKLTNDRLVSMIKSYIYLSGEDILKLPEDSKDIRKIYDNITKGELEKDCISDGKIFRKNAIYVQKKNTVSGECIHEGVLGEYNISAHIERMLNFLNDNKIPLLLRTAIGHYYFGYIHPFYDGNGRTGRFISSMYIKKDYGYLTAMSLARGSFLKKNDYYKAFDITNSVKNKGELNCFVDTFLSILIEGQFDIIENLIDKVEKLDKIHAKIMIDNTLDTDVKKDIMFILSQDYYFNYNNGIEREDIVGYLDGHYAKTIRDEISVLEQEGLIIKVKGRPIVYCANTNYFE